MAIREEMENHGLHGLHGRMFGRTPIAPLRPTCSVRYSRSGRPSMNLFVGLESFADELSAFGQEDIACAVRETTRRAREELQEWDSQLGSLSA